MTHICFSELCWGIGLRLLFGAKLLRQPMPSESMSVRPQWTYYNEMLLANQEFPFTRMDLKISSAKCHPFCLDRNMLTVILFSVTVAVSTATQSSVGDSQTYSEWASCQIRQIAGAHAPGMPGTFSPSPQVSDPDMHHGTCVTARAVMHAGIANLRFPLKSAAGGKTFPAFPVHAQPAILRIW